MTIDLAGCVIQKNKGVAIVGSDALGVERYYFRGKSPAKKIVLFDLTVVVVSIAMRNCEIEPRSSPAIA
jgi:hypothetical protein